MERVGIIVRAVSAKLAVDETTVNNFIISETFITQRVYSLSGKNE